MNVAELSGIDPLNWVLNGGEDYVLLGTAEPRVIERLKAVFEDKGFPLYVIGCIQEEPGLFMRRHDGSIEKLTAGGWDHFR
jgi:thiamine-monophosphate kinase